MKNLTKEKTAGASPRFEITSAGLHIIAMLSMLVDHTLKSVVESDTFLIVLGRLAFPIFAFMAAEGYRHTHNFRRYALRMLLFALLSEIPYNLMKSGTVFDRYDQNVIWTFLLALLTLRAMEWARSLGQKQPQNAGKPVPFVAYLRLPATLLAALCGMLLGVLFMVDYSGAGVLMVLIFYVFHKKNARDMLITFVLMCLINVVALGAFDTEYTFTLAGHFVSIPLQGFAVFSLIPIWLYRGRQGYHSKPFQYVCYAFYPVHMLALYLIGNC